MKKLTINKETVRKLDEDIMEKIHAGKGKLNTTYGPVCPMLTNCNFPC